MALQAGQISLQFVVTLPDLPMREMVAVYRVPQFEPYVFPPSPFQGAGDLLFAGSDMRIAQFRQFVRVSLALSPPCGSRQVSRSIHGRRGRNAERPPQPEWLPHDDRVFMKLRAPQALGGQATQNDGLSHPA